MRLRHSEVSMVQCSNNPYQLIEDAGRTCYKSESKRDEASTEKFIRGLVKRGHESVLEHVTATVRIICDRGVSHELVRHRIASYSQESTRYCNYEGKAMEFIIPAWCSNLQPGIVPWSEYLARDSSYENNSGLWLAQMMWSERTYNRLIKEGWVPQQARSVLPNSLKTEVVATLNIRSWRNFFKLRMTTAAQPDMFAVAVKLFDLMTAEMPVFFDDLIT